MSVDQSLDVVLNGSRNYVQGSQMLGRSAEILSREAGAVSLESCVFKRITDRRVRLCLDSDQVHEAIGTARFRRADATSMTVNFVAEDEPAPRTELHDRFSLAVCSRADIAAGNLAFEFLGGDAFEDRANLIVQAVKAAHLDTDGPLEDLWFTGLRNGSIPLAPIPALSKGSILVKRLRTMAVDRQVQTLSHVTLKSTSAALATHVNFSFRRT